ncbi:MAG: hypothetical protein KatS3mg102_2718 [Planctomycetota bacterium]|nr:MAG: hypothetical protein KatS3mg102_2718 [Planctomycetota bacterium]
MVRHKPPPAEETLYAHDDYLEALAEMGPAGLLGLAGLWAALLGTAPVASAAGGGRTNPGRQPLPAPPSTPRLQPRAVGARVAGSGWAQRSVLCSCWRSVRSTSGRRRCWPLAAWLGGASVLGARLLAGVHPRPLAAGALGGAAAFAAQAAIDFLHLEPGLLAAALLLAVAAPALAATVRGDHRSRAAATGEPDGGGRVAGGEGAGLPAAAGLATAAGAPAAGAARRRRARGASEHRRAAGTHRGGGAAAPGAGGCCVRGAAAAGIERLERAAQLLPA